MPLKRSSVPADTSMSIVAHSWERSHSKLDADIQAVSLAALDMDSYIGCTLTAFIWSSSSVVFLIDSINCCGRHKCHCRVVSTKARDLDFAVSDDRHMLIVLPVWANCAVLDDQFHHTLIAVPLGYCQDWITEILASAWLASQPTYTRSHHPDSQARLSLSTELFMTLLHGCLICCIASCDVVSGRLSDTILIAC